MQEKARASTRPDSDWLAPPLSFFSVLAGPVMARPVIRLGQSIFCETREAGNPHSKFCDYLAWSGWRRRGAWDSSPDNACLRDPSFIREANRVETWRRPTFQRSAKNT
jgi:hypothetical protein